MINHPGQFVLHRALRPNEFVVALAAFVASLPATLPAASPAFDSAADPAYNGGWLSGTNGGFGFGPWSPGTPPGGSIGPLGSSATNGAGDLDNDGDINTPRNASGRAWGLSVSAAFERGGQVVAPGISVNRMLQGQLAVGQTFSVDFDNGIIADPVLSDGMHHPGVTGWAFINAASLDGYEFTVRPDRPDYLFDGMDTGVPLTTEGVHCEFTFLQPRQLGALPYPWEFKITPLSPGSQTHVLTGLWTTDIRFLPDEFVFSDGAAGSDPANAVYINNLSVTNVPEPGSVGPALVGTALLLRRRRRAARRKAPVRVGSSAARSAAPKTGGGNDELADEADGSKTRNDTSACETSHPGFFAVRQHIGQPVVVWSWVCRDGDLASLPVARGNAGLVVTVEGGLPLLKIYVTTVCSSHPAGDEARDGVRG